jgi:hypothetical protein
MINNNISFNKYLPLALLYFFFNSIALPEGLLFTSFLTPFFIYSALQRKIYAPFIWFFILSFIYSSIHFYMGVNAFYYVRSWLLLFCNFSFIIAIYSFIRESEDFPLVAKNLVIVNTFLVIIAVICLLIPFGKDHFWYTMSISKDIKPLPRLKLFMSEASVYSLYIAPLFLFYFFRSINYGLKQYGFALLVLVISLTLSFALGVLIALFISLFITAVFFRKQIFSNKNFNRWLIAFTLFIILGMIVWYVADPENILVKRIHNIISGDDTSSRGRTYEAFILAWKMLKEKSEWFGIGLGQIKVIGRSIIMEYYQYVNMPETVRIPNASAETLVYFGVTGFALRIIAEVFLFFKTKVYTNYFRLSIFIFIFIYQFTGSYFTNIAEYVLWIIAFTVSRTTVDRLPVTGLRSTDTDSTNIKY